MHHSVTDSTLETIGGWISEQWARSGCVLESLLIAVCSSFPGLRVVIKRQNWPEVGPTLNERRAFLSKAGNLPGRRTTALTARVESRGSLPERFKHLVGPHGGLLSFGRGEVTDLSKTRGIGTREYELTGRIGETTPRQVLKGALRQRAKAYAGGFSQWRGQAGRYELEACAAQLGLEHPGDRISIMRHVLCVINVGPLS